MNDKAASFRNENWRFWSEWRDSFASAPIGADRGSPPSSWRRQRSSALHLIVRVSHSKEKCRYGICHSCIFGPSGETRTRGILVPNQAPYQLGHTRILNYKKMLVVVKYVVKEILPQFCLTFNGSNQGDLRRQREVCNIWSSRTDLVFQLPNQALYQREYLQFPNKHC